MTVRTEGPHREVTAQSATSLMRWAQRAGERAQVHGAAAARLYDLSLEVTAVRARAGRRSLAA